MLALDGRLATDEWNEADHPRDESGKFAEVAGGAKSASGEGSKVSNRVKDVMTGAGFKKVKGSNPTMYVHPSGAKILIHPEPGKIHSSTWTSYKPGSALKSGVGVSLGNLLKAAEQAVQQQKAVSASSASSEQHLPISPTHSMSIGEINKISPAVQQPSGSIGPSDLFQKEGFKVNSKQNDENGTLFEKGDHKILYKYATNDWISQKPGHMTKEGNGTEALQNLMAGKPGDYKNSTKSIVGGTSLKVSPVYKPDATTELYTKLKDKAPTPTQAQKDALAKYGGNGYKSINDALRTDSLGGALHTYVKAIDDYLKSATIDEELTLHRGVSGSYAEVVKSIATFTGSKFQEKGFVSTSVGKGFGGDLKLKTTLPKGSKGAAIGNYSGHHSELEVLLPRGTVWTTKAWDPSTKTLHVEADQSHLE